MKDRCNTDFIYREHQKKLFSMVDARVKNREESQDIVQETFVKFEECRQKGCECSQPTAYLYRMALNKVADFFKAKRKKQISYGLPDFLADPVESDTSFPCDPYECTQEFLLKVSPENRQAFIQSDIKHIPQKQTAHELGIPVSTLKSRVQRTRSFLRKEFENCLKRM